MTARNNQPTVDTTTEQEEKYVYLNDGQGANYRVKESEVDAMIQKLNNKR